MQTKRASDGGVWGLGVLVLIGAVGLAALIFSSRARVEPASSIEAPAAREPRRATLDPIERERPEGEAPPARSRGWLPTQGSGAYATDVEEEPDPQVIAFRRAYRGVADAGVPQPFAIAYHRGTLVSSRGLGLRPGASCEVRVMPVEAYAFNCVVRVSCEGVVLYPDDALTAGYAPCRVESGEAVFAEDDSSTDGDRELRFERASRSVIVREHRGREELLSAQIRLGE